MKLIFLFHYKNSIFNFLTCSFWHLIFWNFVFMNVILIDMKIYRKHSPDAALQSVLREWCSENIHQVYRRTSMPEFDFSKVAKQLYWNCTLAWVFSWLRLRTTPLIKNNSEGDFRRLLWASQLTFTYSKLKTETLKKVWSMFKVNKNNTRTTLMTIF